MTETNQCPTGMVILYFLLCVLSKQFNGHFWRNSIQVFSYYGQWSTTKKRKKYYLIFVDLCLWCLQTGFNPGIFPFRIREELSLVRCNGYIYDSDLFFIMYIHFDTIKDLLSKSSPS